MVSRRLVVCVRSLRCVSVCVCCGVEKWYGSSMPLCIDRQGNRPNTRNIMLSWLVCTWLWICLGWLSTALLVMWTALVLGVSALVIRPNSADPLSLSGLNRNMCLLGVTAKCLTVSSVGLFG